MNEPEFNENDPVWKALDAFEGVEPHPQSRARFWAAVSRAEAMNARVETTRRSPRGWFFRIALPGTALACLILAAVIGKQLHERSEEDREIAANLELYENLDLIQNLPQLVSADELSDEDFDEITQ